MEEESLHLRGGQETTALEHNTESADYIEAVASQIVRVTRDEILRNRISEIYAQLQTPRWERIAKNPMLSVILAALVTAVVGTYLISYYATRQVLERERSLLYETRLPKLAEALSRVSLYEAKVVETVEEIHPVGDSGEFRGSHRWIEVVFTDHPIEVSSKSYSGLDAQLAITSEHNLETAHKQSEALYAELMDFLNKNRFWLGDGAYNSIKNYAEGTLDYYFAVRVGKITKELEDKRTQAKTDLLHVQESLLKA